MSGSTFGPGPDGEPVLQSLRKKVENELARFDHLLFRFATEARGSGVVLAIDLREGLGVECHSEGSRRQREIESRQFPWTFQKLPSDSLRGFMVEMFEKNP
jgi:hypothetical protein